MGTTRRPTNGSTFPEHRQPPPTPNAPPTSFPHQTNLGSRSHQPQEAVNGELHRQNPSYLCQIAEQLARDLATLDRLSNGRVVLGAGLGRRPDYELFGESWDLKRIADRADEALTLIDRFWNGESVTYHGDHYQVEGAALLPTPVQKPRIPILVGGLWPTKASVRRGARWDGIMTHFPGDGVLPSDGTPPETHAQELVAFYQSVTDDPGEIFLPASPEKISDEWRKLAVSDLGATWLYTAKIDGQWALDVDKVSEGPPTP